VSKFKKLLKNKKMPDENSNWQVQ